MRVGSWELGVRKTRVLHSALRTPHSAPSHGFTFVELLIAVTMLSILFIGLGAHLQGGMVVWQRATQTAEAVQHERVAFDWLERDLANALVFDTRGDVYGNSPGQLPAPQFDASTMSWFTLDSGNRERVGGVRFVTYACRRVDETQGLWRTSQTVGQARRDKPSAARPQLILPDCEQLSLRYAYLPSATTGAAPLDWSEQWQPDPKQELPRLIDVSITANGRHPRRVCAIPVGVLKPFGVSSP